MKTDPPNQGILNEHATCHEAPTRAQVRERAVELAAMNGRSALDTSKSDWEQAKRELEGVACEEHPQTPAPTVNNHAPMKSTVAALLAAGKGILAADESFPTIEKRFMALGIPANEDNRRAYRELLFMTPGLNEFISGAILFEETLHQNTSSGAFMPEALAQQDIIPGIKVDGGTKDLAGFPGEKITHGLDGLSDRLAAYRERGARFTKWRAVITIGDGLPTTACIEANAQALALFASQSQEAGLVPIVEPEVLMSGNHTLARCEEVMDATLQAVFAALFEQRIVLETMLLKTGMVLPGQDCPQQATTAEIAEATLRCLGRHVPAAVPGVVFLSGGQKEIAATERLNAICQPGGAPWALSFSFGRALQDQAMKTWKGNPANVAAAQAALHHRARCNGLALLGKYTGEEARLSSPAPHQLTVGEAVAVWQNEGDPN